MAMVFKCLDDLLETLLTEVLNILLPNCQIESGLRGDVLFVEDIH